MKLALWQEYGVWRDQINHYHCAIWQVASWLDPSIQETGSMPNEYICSTGDQRSVCPDDCPMRMRRGY